MKIKLGYLITTNNATDPIAVNRGVLKIISEIMPHITTVWEKQGKNYVCIWEKEAQK